MSIAPLHGRPAPLRFATEKRIRWPRYSEVDMKSAPLSTRARKVRRQRVGRWLVVWTLLVAVAALATWWLLRIQS
jgi:hypothetical protein